MPMRLTCVLKKPEPDGTALILFERLDPALGKLEFASLRLFDHAGIAAYEPGRKYEFQIVPAADL